MCNFCQFPVCRETRPSLTRCWPDFFLLVTPTVSHSPPTFYIDNSSLPHSSFSIIHSRHSYIIRTLIHQDSSFFQNTSLCHAKYQAVSKRKWIQVQNSSFTVSLPPLNGFHYHIPTSDSSQLPRDHTLPSKYHIVTGFPSRQDQYNDTGRNK